LTVTYPKKTDNSFISSANKHHVVNKKTPTDIQKIDPTSIGKPVGKVDRVGEQIAKFTEFPSSGNSTKLNQNNLPKAFSEK
jgi:hypothetical protein